MILSSHSSLSLGTCTLPTQAETTFTVAIFIISSISITFNLKANINLLYRNLAIQMQPSLHQQKTYPFIIIGAGLSAFQAALILAEENKDFLMLQASQRIGGRIHTQTFGSAVKNSGAKADYAWFTQKVKDLTLQFGATWIAEDQKYMIKLAKQYNLHLHQQYENGQMIVGKNHHQYLHIDSLHEYYLPSKREILSFFNTYEALQKQLQAYLDKEKELTGVQLLKYKEFVLKYDTMTVEQFLQANIKNQELRSLISNQMLTLQCIQSQKVSTLQFLLDDSSLDNIKFYVGKISATIDGFRVQQGTVGIVQGMKRQLEKLLKQNGKKLQDVLIFQAPVAQIINDSSPALIRTANGNSYLTDQIISTVPISVTHKIKISSLSPEKELIINSQKLPLMYRLNFIFPTAFWRSKFTGYGIFHPSFPFNQIVELSPRNLACGVLAFVFFGDKYQKWNQNISSTLKMQGSQEQRAAKIEQIKKEYCLKVIADMYLCGDRASSHLKQVIMVGGSLSFSPFIGATYQSTSAPGLFHSITSKNLSFKQIYKQDQPKIMFLGSEYADEFAGFMEGAVRYARSRLYKLFGKIDPWREELMDDT